MSHIAKFNLSLTDERRLRAALQALGSNITEGHFQIPASWRSYNTGAGRTVDSQGRCTQWDNKPVVFGFTLSSRYEGTVNRFGFTRDTDGSLCLVGDSYGIGMGVQAIQQAIENSYVNQGVEEIVTSLADLGYYEDEAENTVELQRLVN